MEKVFTSTEVEYKSIFRVFFLKSKICFWYFIYSNFHFLCFI